MRIGQGFSNRVASSRGASLSAADRACGGKGRRNLPRPAAITLAKAFIVGAEALSGVHR